MIYKEMTKLKNYMFTEMAGSNTITDLSRCYNAFGLALGVLREAKILSKDQYEYLSHEISCFAGVTMSRMTIAQSI